MIILLLSLAAAACGSAQQALSPHAWAVVPSDDDASVLLHVPPRVPVDGASPAPDLRIARIARLTQAPEWLVSVGDTVYCIMPADAQGTHRVGRSRVLARGLRDLWASVPQRRLEVLPAIEGDVLAVGTDGKAPHALTRHQGVLAVQRLDPDGWEQVTPEIQTDAFENAALLWSRGEPAIVLLGARGIEWATQVGDAWSTRPVPETAGIDPEAFQIVGGWNGELIGLVGKGDSVHIYAVAPTGVRTLGRVQDVGHDAATILADPGRLVLVTRSDAETTETASARDAPSVASRGLVITELSLVTGQILASGEGTSSSPVSRGEFQSLALLLVACMVLVLIVVVRPSPESAEPVLPPGTAIASSGRRLVSSLLDLVPAVLVASAMLDLSVPETLGPIALPLTGSVNVLPLLLVLAIASAHSAIGEMLTGRSVGKLLTGTFVARVDPEPGVTPVPGRFRPPTPAGALLRNLLKWFLFPATAIVLSDPAGRHRGDLLARSAVLMPVSGSP